MLVDDRFDERFGLSPLSLAAAAAIDAMLDVRLERLVSRRVGAGAVPSNTFHPFMGGANVLSTLLPISPVSGVPYSATYINECVWV